MEIELFHSSTDEIYVQKATVAFPFPVWNDNTEQYCTLPPSYHIDDMQTFRILTELSHHTPMPSDNKGGLESNLTHIQRSYQRQEEGYKVMNKFHC